VVGSGGSLRSGSFGVTSSWAPALDLAVMYPGETRTGVLTLARSGDGRWVYALGAPSVTGPLSALVTVKVYPTSACTGTPLTLPWSQTAVQSLTATPQHCVAVALSGTASGSVQGQAVAVAVPVTADSRSTS
jgi:hypothetical protein